MTSGDISKRISELHQRVQDLRTQSLSYPDQAIDVLSEALEELETSLEQLSATEEELCQQNEELVDAQEVLGKERNFTSAVIDTMGALLVVLDRDGKIVRFNHACEHATGYSFEEVQGKIFFNLFIVPEEKETVKSVFKSICSGDFPNTYENYWATKDGSRRLISWSNTAILDEKGSVEYVISSGIDITERKRQEEKIAKLTKLYAVLSQVNETIVRNHDAELLYSEVCRIVSDVGGFPLVWIGQVKEQQVVPVAWSGTAADYLKDIKVEVQGEFGNGPTGTSIRENRAVINDDFAINPDTSPWRESALRYGFRASAAFPLRCQGKAIGAFTLYASEPNAFDPEQVGLLESLSSDISYALDAFDQEQHRVRAEEALQKAKDELELRVQERTADLTKANVELAEARDAAEAAVEAKAAFLANMSHELRTPMNAVIGFSSLLLDDSLTPDQKDYIERIKIGGESLLAIISDILDFSKAEKEKIKLEHQPISIRHSVEESLDLVAVQAEKKGLNLAYTISYGTPDAIVGDPGRLRQILVNLLSNAVKFTDEGEVSISISSKAIVGNRYQFLFEVRDTGIGMPKEKMDQLFQPFSQLEHTISLKRDGAGLGLAISKNLVELMGGKIWADSAPGEGSTFYFTIEAEAAQGLPTRSRSEVKAQLVENLAEQHPLRILVAEDNPSNQRVLVEMLKRMGYRADAVADGREVIESLERRPYDLIFMDVKMPEMDGLSATQEIRRRWPENGPKIIAITAYAMNGDKEKCLEAGMDDYMAKPVQIGELAEVLKRYSLEAQ